MAPSSRRGQGVKVRLANGDEKDILVDQRPIEDQVKSACLQFHLEFDEGSNYHVFTHGTSSGAALVRSTEELQRAKGSVLGLVTGETLIEGQLQRIRETVELADKHGLRSALELFLLSIKGCEWWLLTEMAVEDKAISRLIGAVQVMDKEEDVEAIELASACMCELITCDEESCQDELQDWIDKDEDGAAAFFRLLLEVILTPKTAFTLAVPTYAVLFLCLYMLQKLPFTVAAIHRAFQGDIDVPEGADPPESLYKELLQACDDEDDNEASAALCLLSATVVAAEESPEIRDEVLAIIEDMMDDDGDDWLAEVLKDPDSWLMDNMMTLSMSACSELATAAVSGTSRKKSFETIARLEKRIEQLTQNNISIQEQFQRKQRAMSKLIPFVKVEADKVIQDHIEPILTLGWDSLHTKRGYTLLHYAAECVEDPAVVELLAAFSTSPEMADDNGMTPLDYARKAGHDAVVQRLVELISDTTSDKQAIHVSGPAGAKGGAAMQYTTQELQRRLDKMERVPQKLRVILDHVLRTGWKAVSWPENFTALHLAAKAGHVAATQLLLDAGAGEDLNKKDTWNQTPLSYSVAGHHKELTALIRRNLPPNSEANPLVKPAEAPPAQPLATAEVLKIKKMSATSPITKGDSMVPGLDPKLQKAVKTIKVKGYGQIDWPNGVTALHYAAHKGSLVGVRALLEVSATPGLNEIDSRGRTPLECAQRAHKDDTELLALLQPTDTEAVGKLQSEFARTHIRASASGQAMGAMASMGAMPSLRIDEDPSPMASPMASPTSPKLKPPPRAAGQASSAPAAAAAARTSITFKQAVGLTRTCDLLRQRLASKTRKPEELGLAELRTELERVRADLQKERQRLKGTGGVTEGPLDEAQLQRFSQMMVRDGKDAVMLKLMQPQLTDGCALGKTQADDAIQQLEIIARILSSSLAKSTGEDGASSKVLRRGDTVRSALQQLGEGGGSQAPTPNGEAAGSASTQPAPTQAQGKGSPSGKGKGTGKSTTDSAEPSPAAPAAAKGGKGKGKDAASGGDAAPTPAAEPAAGGAGKGKATAAGKGDKGGGKAPPATPDGGEVAGKGGGKGGGKGPGGGDKGGGKGGAKKKAKALPTKPDRKPNTKLKTLWTPTFILGNNVDFGTTIWDEVRDAHDMVPIDELEDRFANKTKEVVKEDKADENKKVKPISVISNPQKQQDVEMMIKKYPPAEELVEVLLELDRTDLSSEQIKMMADMCPDDGEVTMLQAKMAETPDAKMEPHAVVFSKLMVIKNVKARCITWAFVLNIDEEVTFIRGRIQEVDALLDCVQQSESISTLLGVMLAVCNYFNGGTKRGRADGFDIQKCLNEFIALKGPDNKELSEFAFRILMQSKPQIFEKLLEELGPLLQNVKKIFQGDTFKKEIKIKIEDYQKACIDPLFEEIKLVKDSYDTVMKDIDQMDVFYIQMPSQFTKAEESLKDLQTFKDQTMEKFSSVLALFNMNPQTSTEDFCLMWDNFLIPPDKINGMDPYMVKNFVNPYFCKGIRPSMYDIQVLWGYQKFCEKEAGKTVRTGKLKRPPRVRRQMSQGKVRLIPSGGEPGSRRSSRRRTMTGLEPGTASVPMGPAHP